MVRGQPPPRLVIELTVTLSQYAKTLNTILCNYYWTTVSISEGSVVVFIYCTGHIASSKFVISSVYRLVSRQTNSMEQRSS